MEFDTDYKVQGKPIYLGILGSHSQVNKQDIHERILHPIMSILGRLPDKLLIPSEGQSSAFISIWAERSHVEAQTIEADWRRLQRRAALLRDARIVKESTHLLVFLGTRSRANELTAIKQAKKGKIVFTVDHATLEVSELVVEG